MTDLVSLAINDEVLRRLAGDECYRRGLDYFTHGHVESLDATETAVCASVRGHQNYAVELSADEGVLDYACNCPVGAEARFCKHCVAVALAWRNSVAAPARSKGRGRKKPPGLADSAAFLREERKEALVEMILEWAKDDARLCDRLILYAARRSGPESSAAAAELAFQRAVRVRGLLRYRETSSWARGVHRAIEPIEQLLKDGQAAAVIELCETALRELCKAIKSVDDSDGHFSALRERLESIHLQACKEAPPPGPALARRLLQWELKNDWEIFYGAVSSYSSILGPEGMKVYRELAEREWDKVPFRTEKSKDAEWGTHFRITKIMECLAKLSGDVERVVAVMSRDLSNAYDYLRIAEAYITTGKSQEALQWAEKGLTAFPVNTDDRLREFIANEYHRLDRHDDAMHLVWATFTERLNLTTYQTLERHATTAGVWPRWRDMALSEVRARISRAQQILSAQPRPFWGVPGGDRSLLVEIFLHERNLEEAWREAQAGGCSDRLWFRLAELREKNHPDDAGLVYLKLAGNRLQAIRNSRYEEPVELLTKAASAMKRANRWADFVQHLDALREQYRSKRNFTKLLEEQRKSLLDG